MNNHEERISVSAGAAATPADCAGARDAVMDVQTDEVGELDEDTPSVGVSNSSVFEVSSPTVGNDGPTVGNDGPGRLIFHQSSIRKRS